MIQRSLVALGLGLAATMAAPLAAAETVREYIPADTVFYNGTTGDFDKPGLADAYPPSWQQAYVSDITEDAEAVAQEHGPGAGMLTALLQDYYTSWAEDDYPLARFGSARDAEYAVYSVGALPVARLGVDDGEAAMSQLEAAEEAAGVAPTKGKIQGIEVRRYGFSTSQSDRSLDLVAAVREGHAVLTLAGSGIPKEALATALGKTKPDASLADNGRLSSLADRHDLMSGSLAYLDHEAIVAGLTNAEANRFGRMIKPLVEAWGESDEVPFQKIRNEACHDEATSMAAKWPYTVSGFSGIKPKAQRVEMRNLVRIADDGVNKQLARLRGHIPSTVDQRPLLELGLGLNIQEVIPALRQLSGGFKDTKRDCKAIRNAQKAVHAQSIDQLQIISRSLGDVRGVTASLLQLGNESENGNGDNAQIEPSGVVEIATTEPQSLWRFAASSLGTNKDAPQPKPGGDPVAVDIGQGFGVDMQVALRNNALVLLAGDTALPKAAGEKALDANGVLSVREDVGAVTEAAQSQSGPVADKVPGQEALKGLDSLNAYLDLGLDFGAQGIALDAELTPAK